MPLGHADTNTPQNTHSNLKAQSEMYDNTAFENQLKEEIYMMMPVCRERTGSKCIHACDLT